MFERTHRKLKRLKDAEVPDGALKRQRERLTAHMDARPLRPALRRTAFVWKPALAAILLFTMLAGTGGAVMAAQGALPGEVLYPVKLASEEARLHLTASAEKRFQLNAERAERRLVEARAIMRAKASVKAGEKEGEEKDESGLEEAMSRYEAHVNDLREMLKDRHGEAAPGAMMDAIDRILVRHGMLVDSATTTGPEERETVRRRAAASAKLGLEMLGDDGDRDDDEEDIETDERVGEEDGPEGKKNAGRFRAHLDRIRAMAETGAENVPGPPAETNAEAKLELRL